MVKFKEISNLTKKEIGLAYQNAKLTKQITGLKLIQAPLSIFKDSVFTHGKLLFVIPKRSGKAHKRNKIRRQLKAVFFEEKLYEKPFVSILIVYKEAMEFDFDKIKNFLTSSFDKS